ncbi:MAG TPA: hypothetical protein VF041_16920 [Gemmatimonadaceae bacterium]
MDIQQSRELPIERVLARLRERLGAARYVVEYWDDDLCAVRLAPALASDRVVIISTCDKEEGRYDVSLSGPPAPGAPRPSAPGGRYPNIDFDTLVAVVAAQLELPLPSRSSGVWTAPTERPTRGEERV